MLPKFFRKLWGNLSEDEIKKFAILSGISMLILGDYWLLRTMKNALFSAFVGYKENAGFVKIVSAITAATVVLIYSKLVDLLSREKLIFVFSSFMGISLIILSYFIYIFQETNQ